MSELQGSSAASDPGRYSLFLFLFLAVGTRGIRLRTEINLRCDEFPIIIGFYITADFLAHHRIIEGGWFSRFVKLGFGGDLKCPLSHGDRLADFVHGCE